MVLSLSADLESSKKQVEVDRKAAEELIRERDILNKVCDGGLPLAVINIKNFLHVMFSSSL